MLFFLKLVFHGAVDIAVGLAFFGGGAFVVGFLSAGGSDEELDAARLEVHFEGDDGEAFMLFRFL